MPSRAPDRQSAGRPLARISWYALMGLVGLGFGLLADQHPFGADSVVHPLVTFLILLGLSLLALRVLLGRPASAVISNRALIAGGAVGFFLFLAGNFVAAQGLLPG